MNLWPSHFPVAHDHCSSVLAGSYDVPFNPAPGQAVVVLDIGANIGAFTKWAVSRWPGCTVHAYEPQPENYQLLLETKLSLGPAADQVRCHEVAVYNQASHSILFEGPCNCGEWTLQREMGLGKGRIAVRVIDARDLPRGDVLKLDVEGSELPILEALGARLGEFSAIMLEIHGKRWEAPIQAILEGAGFTQVGRTEPSRERIEVRWMRADLG